VTAGATQAILPQYKPWLILMTRSLSLTPVMIAMKRQFFCKTKPVRIALNDDPWQRIEKACSSRTKMIIINNPHNPTGKF
jgi:methionine aminotransferase